MSLFRQPRRKATPQEIATILSATGSTHEIARALGISQATVWRVKKEARADEDKSRQYWESNGFERHPSEAT